MRGTFVQEIWNNCGHTSSTIALTQTVDFVTIEFMYKSNVLYTKKFIHIIRMWQLRQTMYDRIERLVSPSTWTCDKKNWMNT